MGVEVTADGVANALRQCSAEELLLKIVIQRRMCSRRYFYDMVLTGKLDTTLIQNGYNILKFTENIEEWWQKLDLYFDNYLNNLLQ